MANAEEDATELQFPKGMCHESAFFDEQSLDVIMCANCCSSLLDNYVQCIECSIDNISANICLQCFAKGAEFGAHENNHSYALIRNDFPLFSPNWKAKDEVKLIECIAECGIGNWLDVSRRMQTKSAEECKRHYLKHYTEFPCPELKSLLNQPDCLDFVKPTPMPFISGTEDPPRPLPHTNSSRELASYNAARSDFVVEYDNNTESIIQDIDLSLFEDEENSSVGKELQAAVLDIYRWRLGERQRRKKIIRGHGLIHVANSNKTMCKFKYFAPLCLEEMLPKLCQLTSFQELHCLMIGLNIQAELKQEITELKELRLNGVTKKNLISIYEQMKKRREYFMKGSKKLLLNQNGGEINIEKLAKLQFCSPLQAIARNGFRYNSIPLQILGRPGYEELDEEEREICSQQRIFPKKYLTFKNILINECNQRNGLSLAVARTLIKIDVNKIKKIHDYLLNTHQIFLPK